MPHVTYFFIWAGTSLGVVKAFSPVLHEFWCAISLIYGLNTPVVFYTAMALVTTKMYVPVIVSHGMDTYSLGALVSLFKFFSAYYGLSPDQIEAGVAELIKNGTLFQDVDLKVIFETQGDVGLAKYMLVFDACWSRIIEAHPELLEQMTKDANSTFGTTIIKALPNVSFKGHSC